MARFHRPHATQTAGSGNALSRRRFKKKPYAQSAYYNLAKAYRLLGDTAAATEQLKLFQHMKSYYDQTYAIEGALAEAPTNTTLRLKLAEVHLAHKHIAAAIATYQAIDSVESNVFNWIRQTGKTLHESQYAQTGDPTLPESPRIGSKCHRSIRPIGLALYHTKGSLTKQNRT